MATLVSAIIPCYNQSRWVREALDSALSQSHPNLQIVAVDDGSTDGTWGILQSYGSQITAVRQRNQGLSAARNTAIRHSTGDWFALLDSDDRWLPGKIARQMEMVSTFPQAGLVFSGCRIFGETEQPEDVGPKEIWTLAELAARNPVQCPTAMFSRAAVERVGLFDESLRSCEDWDLWLRIAAAGFRVVAVPEVLAEYRRHGGSMSTHAERMYFNGRRVLQKNRMAMDAAGMTPADWEAAWHEIHAAYSARLFARALERKTAGHRAESVWTYARAIMHAPGKLARLRRRFATMPGGNQAAGHVSEPQIDHGM